MTDATDGGGRKHPLAGDELANLGEQPKQYDEDLGRRMARDAQRVSAGELSEVEFHEKYHDAVVAEFGTDDRPIETGGKS